MGMDGLSLANTGAIRESTSMDYASQVEESVKQDDANKQVDKTGISPRIKDDEKEKEGKKKQSEKRSQDDEAGVFEKSKTPEEEKSELENLVDTEDDLSSHNFYVKITKDGDIFELYDKNTNRLVEKISSEEINQLMLKLNMASGILVNRKV